MSISIHSQTGKLSPMGTGRWASSQTAGEPGRVPERDQAAISPAGREALEGAQELSPLERALQNTTQEQVQAWMADWSAQHQLEVNWDAAVDPDHSIYAKAYMDGLASQMDQSRRTIEAYYQEGHQENLRFSNPYNHLVEKYQYSGSPYFRGDWSEAQRAMAFRQERALLWGGRVALNDPWALAASGGVPSGQAVESAARQAAREALDGLIAQYKKEHGVE
ncbi:hypothetical protein AALA61_07980 [Oscillospiraceae bacterium 42-9]